jgi:thiamine-phosphate pyrophosphorylase
VHNSIEAMRAKDGGADYVTLAPVFESASKPGYGPALGLDGLRAVVRDLAVPVLALGGIGPDDVQGCLRAGAAGVAVMGGVMRAEDPGAVLREYLASVT